MYKLRKAQNSPVSNPAQNSEPKSDRNVYLKENQWSYLEKLAETNNVSLNQTLRDILDFVRGER